jgi:sulfane dehydrogenase subunit SoxC
MSEPNTTDAPQSRRAFLRGTAAAGAGLLAASTAVRAQTPDPLITQVQDYASAFGDPVDATPYGLPIRHEAHVVRRNVEWLTESPVSSINFTPIHALEGTITPQG